METPKGFSETKKDLTELKKTATDATRDLASTASVHADKARSQVSDLATHFQEEAPAQFDQVRASFGDVVKSGVDYVTARPVQSLGIALGVGVVIGFMLRSNSRD